MDSKDRRGRVLVLEENEDLRELLVFSLSDDGYVVRGVSGAVAAVHMLERWPCQLVLGAESLGNLDGVSCLKMLSERFPSIKCVALLSTPSRLNERYPAFLEAVLCRPLDVALLRLTVHKALYEQCYRGWMQSVWKFMKERGQSWGDWCLLYWRKRYMRLVEIRRERCFREFFDHVRSGKISFACALVAWDNLESLEEDVTLASSGNGNLRVLAGKYRYLGDILEFMVRSPGCLGPVKREKMAVDSRTFMAMFRRLRRGDISFSELCLAPMLRRSGGSSAREKRLFKAIWGAEKRSALWT